MRVIFAGTPAFSVAALVALRAAGHDLVLVLTQPDRPAGRGMAARPSAVKMAAQSAGLEVFQPATLRDPAAQGRLHDVAPDVIVVVAYGLILPQAVLDLPRFGALNIHASLLPRWRGAAPIQRAIEAGDAESGVAIMQMEAGLDTGPVLREERTPITDADTAGTLHDRLSEMGARNLVAVLAALTSGAVRSRAQAAAGVTYAHKIEKAEAELDWNQPAKQLACKIRAFNPAPGAQTALAGTSIKVWFAQALAVDGPTIQRRPGEIVSIGDAGIDVACADGVVRITELQRAGAKRLHAREFARGAALTVGTMFDQAGASRVGAA